MPVNSELRKSWTASGGRRAVDSALASTGFAVTEGVASGPRPDTAAVAIGQADGQIIVLRELKAAEFSSVCGREDRRPDGLAT